MKIKTLIAACFLFIAGFTAVDAQVFQNKDVTITKLEKDMWVVETSDKTTMYIIEGTKAALLIDTGTKCDQLDSIVRLITQKPLKVVITHFHPDHSGNIYQFKEIYLHPADTVLYAWQKPYLGKVHFMKDGDVFDLGNKKIEVKATPGHTPGSVVLLDWQSRNCYSGDSYGSGQLWMQLRPNLPMKTYVNSCKLMEKLMDKGINKVYCGHYPYVKKAYDKSYITEMRTLAEQLATGKTAEAKPYPTKVSAGTQNSMIITLGQASIVFDPEKL
jgi:hydroxyacylglutathione hydrolase